MVGHKPEHWRIITPVIGGFALLASIGSNVSSWSISHTIESFDGQIKDLHTSISDLDRKIDAHIDKVNDKFDVFAKTQADLNGRLSLIQGQCCRKSFISSGELAAEVMPVQEQ